MTLSKLAKLANVSISVVSKAFSGRDDVSDSMREHVFAVARENGCFEQFYHAPYDKPVVALILPEIISNHYVLYLEALKKSLEECGYTLLLSISNFDADMERELIRYYTESAKVDAIITFRAPTVPPPAKTVCITFSGKSNDYGTHICRDLRTGVCEALDRLSALGHKKIAFVGEMLATGQGQLLRELCRERDILLTDDCFIVARSRFERAGREGADRLCALKEKPSAVFCAYGYIAVGLLDALREQGVSVPDDISVISMNNCANPFPPEGSVACIPSIAEAHCREAIAMLNEQLASGDRSARTVRIPTFFVDGATLARARENA